MAKTKHSKEKKKEKKAKKAAARHAKPNGKPPARASSRHKPPARGKAPEKAAARPAAAARGRADAGLAAGAAAAAVGAVSPKAVGVDGRPAKSPKARKSSRRPTLLRRGPDGEILAPGDLLLPGGTQRSEEIHYLFRGCAAAERPNVGEEAIAEVFARRPAGEFPSDREELQKALGWARDRFERGNIEPVIPARTNVKRTFQGVVERARHRRREIGAFLRGLDLGHTETNHMDAHGEASLQSLMEWAARLENLTEADEPVQADYASFHRGLDQLESTTEALILDVEQTLRRLRDRLRR